MIVKYFDIISQRRKTLKIKFQEFAALQFIHLSKRLKQPKAKNENTTIQPGANLYIQHLSKVQ